MCAWHNQYVSVSLGKKVCLGLLQAVSTFGNMARFEVSKGKEMRAGLLAEGDMLCHCLVFQSSIGKRNCLLVYCSIYTLFLLSLSKMMRCGSPIVAILRNKK